MTDNPGFHRHQNVVALPDSGLEVTIEAKPGERKSLAAYLDVTSVETVRAVFLVQRWRGQGVRLTGSVEAAVTQTCVVTLEPVQVRVSLAVDRKYLPETMLDRDADPHEMLVDPDGEDPPDPLPHALDLGEVAAEEIALNLDPYPRKPGAAAPDDVAPQETAENPFAALKNALKP